MERRLWRLLVAGVLFASCLVSCGDDQRRPRAGFAQRTEGMPPDSPGAGGGSGGGMHGCGGRAGGGPGHSTSPGPLPPPASSLAPGSMCEADGWCWYSPLPSGSSWAAVAGAGRTDLWIGGFTQNLLHFDGGQWHASPSPLFVLGSWGAAKDDVWFVGELVAGDRVVAAIAHWDGVAVTVTATFDDAPLTDVWGSGPDDVYAVGDSMVQHWDGTAWSAVPGVRGGNIAGTGARDVWVGGDGLFHFDGTRWSGVPAFQGISIFDLSTVAPGEVWAIAVREEGAVVERFDGVSSTVMFHRTDADVFLTALQVVSDSDVWLVGSRPPLVPSGTRGVAYHFDGSAWTSGLTSPAGLRAVDRTPGLGIVAVGEDGGIVRLVTEPVPHVVDLRVGPTVALRATFGSSPADMWAVGDAGTVLHYDGRNTVSVPSGTTADLNDVWGTGPSDVWAVGAAGTVLHYDGQAFVSVSSGTDVDLRAVFTVAAGDVWIGGDQGVLARRGGTGFAVMAVPGINAMSIYDLHGLARDDIWLAGGTSVLAGAPQGFVSHFDGTAWSAIEVLTFGPPVSRSEAVVRIWELAPNDIWALSDVAVQGDATGKWHFDGATWTGSLGNDDGAAFMFPPQSGTRTFAFGPHDLWRITTGWQRSTQ